MCRFSPPVRCPPSNSPAWRRGVSIGGSQRGDTLGIYPSPRGRPAGRRVATTGVTLPLGSLRGRRDRAARRTSWFGSPGRDAVTLRAGSAFAGYAGETNNGWIGDVSDPLLIAETGSGIPYLTYDSTLLFALLTAQLFLVARNDVKTGGKATTEQWGLTALRVYVGLMFIAHFARHLFGGPASFAIFSGYFASIGLPAPAAFVILAGLIELAVTIGLAFGVMARLAALGAAAYLAAAAAPRSPAEGSPAKDASLAPNLPG